MIGTRPSAVLLLCLVLGGFASQTVAAGKFQCWTNSDGVHECGHSVPPEYSQQRVETLNDRGMVVEVKEAAKTGEQLEQEKREEELRKEQERLEAEQRRKDKVLLRSFTTERDLKIFYEDKTTAIENRIELTRTTTTPLNKKLEQLQKRAADVERSGKPVPEDLTKNMESVKRQIKHNNQFITGKQQEIAELKKKYEADLKRFRELKSVNP